MQTYRKCVNIKMMVRYISVSQAIKQNPVSVDLKMIQNDDKQLFDKFEEAYNDDGLGIMIVNNIPGFPEKRQKLLPLAKKLASLPKTVLDSLETPEFYYGVGWSHGKEKYKGEPDYFKGSFYANPCYDSYKSGQFDKNGNRVVYNNKWPEEDLPELKFAFQDLGSYINQIGILIAKNLDRYIKHRCSTYINNTFEKTLMNSTKMTGRLLHFYPTNKNIFKPCSEKEDQLAWCGWHNDYGTLSGLCSAIYLDEDSKEIDPSEIEDGTTGFFAMNRHHQLVSISIPRHSLAFQIGESGQIMSGVHSMGNSIICIYTKPQTKGVSRNSFAVFMEPNFENRMIVPEGIDPQNVHKPDPTNEIPLIENRWENGDTFEMFEKKTVQKYFEF